MGDQVPYSSLCVFFIYTVSKLQNRHVSTHPFKMKWKYGLYCMFNYMIMVMLRIKHVKAKVAFSRLTASLWREPLHVVIASIHPVPQGRRDGEGGRKAGRET